MLYIQESLTPGEHIVRPAFYHWMYVAHSSVWASIMCFIAIVVMILGAIYSYYPTLPPNQIGWALQNLSLEHYLKGLWQTHLGFRLVAFGLVIYGFLHVGMTMIIRATTEIAVTNHRLILKRGLVARNVRELRVENIESVEVKQSVLGRVLHYGRVIIYGTGVGEIKLPALVSDPIDFRRAVLKARESTTAYTGSLDG